MIGHLATLQLCVSIEEDELKSGSGGEFEREREPLVYCVLRPAQEAPSLSFLLSVPHCFSVCLRFLSSPPPPLPGSPSASTWCLAVSTRPPPLPPLRSLPE